jgi:hypothetical protein
MSLKTLVSNLETVEFKLPIFLIYKHNSAMAKKEKKKTTAHKERVAQKVSNILKQLSLVDSVKTIQKRSQKQQKAGASS